jgi:drug/metabolite transporter (DMT)-like permease
MSAATNSSDSRRGVPFAIASAVLFGLSTPFARQLLPRIDPWLLAGLLYLGSGTGLALYRGFVSLSRRTTGTEASLSWSESPWLLAAIICGGVLGPALLMIGLRSTPASTASLLLNLEGVFTALIAWFVFGENFDARIAWGMALISAGSAILSWPGGSVTVGMGGTIAIAIACLAWAADNNFTRKVSMSDPLQIAMLKGLVAGTVNTAIGLGTGSSLPHPSQWFAAGLVGFLGYGVSLTLFVHSLRHLGAARTGAYFSLAPFIGALVSLILFREHFDSRLPFSAALMGIGLWLHLTERHEHEHHHEPLEHEHPHVHDAHHQHTHRPSDPPGEPHTHWHRHEPLVHSHPHYPDLHHQHRH